jgi:hypothetical protein
MGDAPVITHNRYVGRLGSPARLLDERGGSGDAHETGARENDPEECADPP